MADDIAIKVDGVSKSFKLPHEKNNSIKGIFVNAFRHSRTYEKQKVLKDISFEIKKGEFFGIVGRNGSGKSTLLKLLAGIYSPDKGAITINGKLTPFIELGVGFNPELTGRENVFLNGALLGFNRKEMNALYDEIVDFAELHKFMDQKLKNYSSGMQVRLAFSIAIRANTDILVLDEVLAVGDANFQKKCFDYFRKLKRDKKTVILVSHDMDSVRKFSDRAMLLEKSEIVLIASADKVSDEYTKQNIEKAEAMEKANATDAPKDKQTEIPTKKTAYVKSVKLSNKEGRPIKSFVGDQPMRIRVEYVVNKPVEELNIGLGLHSEASGYVFSYNTQMDSYDMKRKAGVITLNIDNLPLLNGNYYFNVVCFGFDEFIPYDLQTQIVTFEVRNPGPEKRYRGIVNLKHEWIS